MVGWRRRRARARPGGRAVPDRLDHQDPRRGGGAALPRRGAARRSTTRSAGSSRRAGTPTRRCAPCSPTRPACRASRSGRGGSGRRAWTFATLVGGQRRLGCGRRRAGLLPPLQQPRLRAARRGRRPDRRRRLVGRRGADDPRAARDEPDDVPPGGAARAGLQRRPLRRHADPRAAPGHRRDGAGRPGVEHRRRPRPLGEVPGVRPPRRARRRDPARGRPPGARLAAGYGLGLRLVPWDGRHLVGHTGSMPGFLASLFVDPATGDGAVALANATTGLRHRRRCRRSCSAPTTIEPVRPVGAHAAVPDEVARPAGAVVLGQHRLRAALAQRAARAAQPGRSRTGRTSSRLRRRPDRRRRGLPPRRGPARRTPATTGRSATSTARRSSTRRCPTTPTSPIPGGHPTD